jgi:hypothetical protein
MDEKTSFQICVLIFFPTTYSQKNTKYIFHQFAYQLSLIEFEINSNEFNPIVELELNSNTLNGFQFSIGRN